MVSRLHSHTTPAPPTPCKILTHKEAGSSPFPKFLLRPNLRRNIYLEKQEEIKQREKGRQHLG